MRSLPSGWNTILAKLGFVRRPRKKSDERNPFSHRLRIESLEYRRVLAITVNTFIDEFDMSITDGDVSLRDAVFQADPGETIDFASSLNNSTIELSLALGQIAFSKSLTIDASALDSLTIDAVDPTSGQTGQGMRIFDIGDPSNGSSPPLMTLVGLTLTGGDVPVEAPHLGQGGAIRSAARLVISECEIFENEAQTGGAIFVQVAPGGSASREVLRIENSIVEDNLADGAGGIAGHGGAITVISGDPQTLTNDQIVIINSTISDNVANRHGGAVYLELFGADATISGTTFEFNEALHGGGIYAQIENESALTVEDSYFFQNEVQDKGGGIFAECQIGSSLSLDDVTFEDNDANRGAGLFSNSTDSVLLIDASEFINNDASFGGGGLHAEILAGAGEVASALISNSLFTQTALLDIWGWLRGERHEAFGQLNHFWW